MKSTSPGLFLGLLLLDSCGSRIPDGIPEPGGPAGPCPARGLCLKRRQRRFDLSSITKCESFERRRDSAACRRIQPDAVCVGTVSQGQDARVDISGQMPVPEICALEVLEQAADILLEFLKSGKLSPRTRQAVCGEERFGLPWDEID